MKRLLAVLWLVYPVLLATALLPPGSALAGPAVKPILDAAQLSSEGDRATLELAFTAGTPEFHIFYLANPDRAVIDLAAIDWRAAPAGPFAGGGLVTGLRHGVRKSGASRLVLDLAAPARIAGTHYRRGKAGVLYLAFNLQQVSGAAFADAVGGGQEANSRPVAEVTDIVTAAGPTPTGPALRTATTRNATAQGMPGQAVTAQRAIAQPAVARAAKEADLPPLLTGDETAQREDAEARDSRSLKYTTHDGYSLSYMRPDGDAFGAGVTLGLQF